MGELDDFRELIERSSLGTPDAKRMREVGRRVLAGRMTGVSEEQADWDESEREGPR